MTERVDQPGRAAQGIGLVVVLAVLGEKLDLMVLEGFSTQMFL